ncbi:MAG: hypothetical protein ABJA02_06375 [Acidobacteriota bacterium]
MSETALDKLKRMTAWTTEPELTESDLTVTLAIYARVDANGYAPTSEEWLPTYDMNGAAAEAWLVKAARASPLTEVDPGSGIVSSKIFDNCRAMARIYSAKRRTSVSVR